MKQLPKKLEEMRSDKAYELFSFMPSDLPPDLERDFVKGFNDGALAVMEQAEKLAEALEHVLLYSDDFFATQEQVLSGYKEWRD